MFFKEYSEFIEALYNIYYMNINEEIKRTYYRDIYEEYRKFGSINKDFEEIYNDIVIGVVRVLSEDNLLFLRTYNGLLLSISNLLKLKVKIHYLDNCKYIKRVTPLLDKSKNYHCLQCDNSNQDEFFTFRNDRFITTYCTRCIEFGRCDNVFPKFNINIPFTEVKDVEKPTVILSDVQELASREVVENAKSSKNTLVWAVCGAGKTEIIYDLIYYALTNNKTICMAIPRKDVVKELYIRFTQDFPSVTINILYGDKKTLVDSCFYIMTTHQLVKFYDYFDIIIIDEVDAFPYSGDQCLEQGAMTSLRDNGCLVYLSATPSKKIKKFVDNVVKIPIRYHRYLLPVPKIKVENKKVFTYERESKVIKEFVGESLKRKRRVLIFVPTILMCERLNTYLVKMLDDSIKIGFVNSSDKKRDEKIERFKNWEINIFITTTVLERGVTFDYLDVLVFDASHDVFTKEGLIQIAGRVGRKEYDYNGNVIFLSDVVTKNMKNAIKEIQYMNDLAKYRKLNRS